MSTYRTRNQLLLVGIQSSPDAEETLSPSTHAVQARFPVGYSPQFDTIDTDYAQESLSQSAPITGGGGVSMSPSCYLKGSGAAGTTAPDFDALLRACAMSQTALSAAVTGQAQAGGASTITLAAGASNVDDAYKGMPIRITNGTGVGQVACITAYNGTTKVATVTPAWTSLPNGVQPDATSEYSIDACHLYRPVSEQLEVITAWLYQHHNDPLQKSRRRRLYGGAGTFTFTVAPRALVPINFVVTGLLPAVPDDVVNPSAPVFQTTDPEPFVNAQAYLGDGAVKFSEMSFDLGAVVERSDNPAATYGFDPGQVSRRVSSGRIVPNLTLNSSRNAFNDWLTSTSRPLWLRWGSAAGRRVSILLPEIRYTGNEPTDIRGFAGETLPFRSVQRDGEIFICIH